MLERIYIGRRFCNHTERLEKRLCSHMNISITNTKELTLYWHALIAFKQAKSIAELMIDLNLCSQENRFAILFGSLCGFYARPFGPNHGLERLSDDIIPTPYRARHFELKILRNQVFMHADSSSEMSDGHKINELKFSVSSDGKALVVENDYIIPKKETFGQILDLLNILIVSINSKITEYLNNGMNITHSFEADTRYSLKIREDDEVIFEKEK